MQYQLLKGDCIQHLTSIESNTIDGVITDPPYSSGGQFRSDKTKSTGTKYTFKNQKFSDFPGDNRDQRGFEFWATMWMSECYRTMKDGAPICVFTDWRQLPLMTDILQAAGFVWRGVFVWDKTAGCRPTKGRFSQQAEFVIWGSKGPMPLEREVPHLHGLHTCAVTKGGRFHQTGKPVELMSEVIKIVPPGGTILDPFCGSGSTGVAALQNDRNFIGIEYTDAYYEVSEQRLKDAA